TYEEVEFATPTTINEEVRILCHSTQGEANHNIYIHYEGADVKAGEYLTYGDLGDWNPVLTCDCAYKYTYEVEEPAAGGGPAALVAAGII
ncbi:unnamed protein product, partial [marine sediment metagenome]